MFFYDKSKSYTTDSGSCSGCAGRPVRDTSCGRGRVGERIHVFACRIYEESWNKRHGATPVAAGTVPAAQAHGLARSAGIVAEGVGGGHQCPPLADHPDFQGRTDAAWAHRRACPPWRSSRPDPVQCFWSVQATRPTSCVSFLARGSVRGGWSLFSPRSMSTSWPISRKTRLKTSPAPGSMRA